MAQFVQGLRHEDLGAGRVDPPADEPVLRGLITGRPMFAGVDVYLKPGQKVVGDAGSLLWMDEGVQMRTGMSGGCFDGCGRTCAGESCCLNTYTAPSKGGMVGLGFPLPGDLVPFACAPGGAGWILSKGAFVAGTDNLKISARFAGCCAAAASGEGPFLTRVVCKPDATSPGMFYAGGFGAITRHDIPAERVFLVDNGLFFAAHDKQQISITLFGGLKQCCCGGGEGLVMRFTGPCTIFTQNRDPQIFKPAEEKPLGDASAFT